MRRYAYLLLSCFGILFLYFLAMLSQPTEISIDEIEHFEGKRVIVDGIVVKKISLEESESLIIQNGNSSLHIFSTFPSHTSYGDEVKVLGKVEKYKGQWEVIAEEIRIIKKWDTKSIPLWELAENAMKYNGRNVNVTGYVKKIYSKYLIITDEEGNYEIKVFYPSDYNISMLKKNYPHVCVKAFFQYDEKSFSFSLNIKNEEHGIEVLND